MDNVYDIKQEKNLNYILPVRTELIKDLSDVLERRIAVIIHLHYLDTIEYYLKYIEEIPSSMDIIFTFSDYKVKEALQKTAIGKRGNCKYIEKQNRGRDISSFLVACRREIMTYEYICFLHDKREKSAVLKKDVEKWIRCLWENMIGSSEYIKNIVLTLYQNQTLGLLTPPFPVTDHLSTFYMRAWGHNFGITKALADKLGLNCNLDITKPPITLGTVFWAKTAALKKLFEIDWRYENFDEEPLKDDGTLSHAIERILAYVAQDAGYESGWVMSDQYAGIHFEQIQYALKKAFNKLEASLGISWISEIDDFESNLRELLNFVNKFDKFYIYGAGILGMKYFTMLKNEQKLPVAFLVSDSLKNPQYIQGIPVCLISDIDLNERCGIIVAVAEIYQEEVIRAIKNQKAEFSNLYVRR